jgi:hypothetical protein
MLFAVLFFSGKVFAQQKAEKVLESANVVTISPKDFKMSLNGQIILPFEYGKATLSNTEDVRLLKYVDVYKIDLVYTWHSSGTTEIRQKPLNLQRLTELEKLIPEILSSKKIKWELVVQTDKDIMHEKDLFHGFVVHYKTADR